MLPCCHGNQFCGGHDKLQQDTSRPAKRKRGTTKKEKGEKNQQ
jgi:hypothetical protein